MTLFENLIAKTELVKKINNKWQADNIVLLIWWLKKAFCIEQRWTKIETTVILLQLLGISKKKIQIFKHSYLRGNVLLFFSTLAKISNCLISTILKVAFTLKCRHTCRFNIFLYIYSSVLYQFQFRKSFSGWIYERQFWIF